MASKTIFAIVLLACVLVQCCDSGRILAAMPLPSYSHQIVFYPLWLKLHSRGHHITLLTTDPITNSNLTNFRQVDLGFAYTLWHDKHNISHMINTFNENIIQCVGDYTELVMDIFNQELECPEVQKIINDETEHFDLVIVEILNPLMAAFSKRFNCPFIGVSSMDVFNLIHDSLGNPTSPALYPDYMIPNFGNKNVFQRVATSFYSLGMTLFLRFYLYVRSDQVVRKHFGNDTPKLVDLQANASLVFLNTNPVLHNIRPLVSNVISIGGAAHITEQQSPLPSDIQLFLDQATSGAIYFSLGTNVKSKDLPEETKQNLIAAFSELDYKVIWKFEDSKFLVGPNILIKQWLPQQQILRHPNVKLFITQGGLQSLEEAVYFAVPIVAIPFYLDQYSNVRKAIDMGVGIVLDHKRLHKDVLKAAISEIINEEKYKNAALKLSTLLREQPASGIDRAVWWTEYVLKHKGAKFIKPSQVPLYQYLLIDVLAFLIFTLIATTYFWYFIIRWFVSKVIRRRKKTLKLE